MRNMLSRTTPCGITLVLLICLYPSQVIGQPLLEDRFASLDGWEILDFAGDATVKLDTDPTAPPGYGPQVLQVEGDHVMGLARAVKAGDGTLVVLYRELEPLDRDADGILLFNAQYGEDISVERNTKTIRPMIWLEQDNDSGLHIRAKLNESREIAYAEQSGVGLVTDEWNKTNWIWQKVRYEGGNVSAKYWPAHREEPDTWVLQTSVERWPMKRLGFRIGSGDIAIAYFAFSPDDIRPVAPDLYLVPLQDKTICGQPHLLNLYCNVTKAHESYSLAILQGDVEIKATALDGFTLSKGSEHRFAIVPPGLSVDLEGTTVLEATIPEAGARAVVRDSNADVVASYELSCTNSDAIMNQMAAVEAGLARLKAEVSTSVQALVQFDVASAHRDLAAERLKSGDHGGADRSLKYALDALKEPIGATKRIDTARNIWRENSIVFTSEGPRVRILGRLGIEGAQLRLRFYANEELVASGTGADLGEGILARPFLGEYRIEYSDPDLAVRQGLPQRLLATVVEARNGQIHLNGEPFLVKGVNVHSLDAGDPDRSRRMLRIFKRLGFNMLRGDYPPLWQIEMAHEENLAWSVLAPFSCASTDEIFAEFDERPMAHARAKARDFIADYREHPGVLLWNSCNEIGNETTDFLVSMYPLYKHYDPFGRPVHYANLYGQDRWQGQDVMAVNYYFAPGQTPEDRHPLIQRSINIAKEHGLPIIYTEYNSYHGPVPEKGVEAIYGLYEWGIENGMSGGFMYDKWMSNHHPGVFNKDLEVDRGMETAFIDVFADAKISILEQERGHAKLRVTNKRAFTLRRFVVEVDRREYQVPDIGPHASATISLETEESLSELSGHMRFETHYGFRSHVPFSLPIHS